MPVQDVNELGLGLLLFPEWYSLDSMARMRFFDDNTRSWWAPATGGSNIPAVNDLMAPYGLAFGDTVVHGVVTIGSVYRTPYSSGTHLINAPTGAQLLSATLQDRTEGQTQATAKSASYYVLSFLAHGSGRIATFGDSNCVDANHATSHCHDLLFDMFTWTAGGEEPAWSTALTTIKADLISEGAALPVRPSPDLLQVVSHVLNNPAECYLNSAVGMQKAVQVWTLMNCLQILICQNTVITITAIPSTFASLKFLWPFTSAICHANKASTALSANLWGHAKCSVLCHVALMDRVKYLIAYALCLTLPKPDAFLECTFLCEYTELMCVFHHAGI